MKPRHAAALALVGRYLMVPPRTGTTVDKNAARDRWKSEPISIQWHGVISVRKSNTKTHMTCTRILKSNCQPD